MSTLIPFRKMPNKLQHNIQTNRFQSVGHDYWHLNGQRLCEKNEAIARGIIDQHFDGPYITSERTTYCHYWMKCEALNEKPMPYKEFCDLVAGTNLYEERRLSKQAQVIDIAERCKRYISDNGEIMLECKASWNTKYAEFGRLCMIYATKVTNVRGATERYMLDVWTGDGDSYRKLLAMWSEPFYDVYQLKRGAWIDQIKRLTK